MKHLSYANTLLHRLVKDGWIQGGDVITGRGDGGASIYGPTFPDECFAARHDRVGTLAMANRGPHSNSSQFYITFQKIEYLDFRKVVFGRLLWVCHGSKY